MARALLSDRVITTALKGAEDAVQKWFVQVIHQQLARVLSEAHPDGFEQIIDREAGKAIEAVKPFGTAYFTFSYLGRVVTAALVLLKETSPILSGAYQAAHAAYVDGRKVEAGAIGAARKVIITDTVKYARVIEAGAQGRVPWSKQQQVPAAGVYRSAAKTLARKFGGIADIQFTWAGVDAASTSPGTNSRARFPALLIEAR